jgi:hypothetical protein
MIIHQSIAESGKATTRETRWLNVLESELRSRIGWADEAVSPFAIRRRTAAERREIPPPTLRTGEAA